MSLGTQNPLIRQATASDAAGIAALIRRSFRPEDLALTIYGCEGIVAYLQDRFECRAKVSCARAFVAEEDGITGFVELCSSASGVFLNYIATDKQVHGRGLGTRLLKHALSEMNAAPGTCMTLDVFGHNHTAKEWYLRLGFDQLESIGFWRGQVDSVPRACTRLHLIDANASAARQEQFGFSTLTIEGEGERFTVGRIGASWFRINDPRLLRKPEILRSLLALESERELLVNMQTAEIAPDLPMRLELLLQSDRLRTTLPLSL